MISVAKHELVIVEHVIGCIHVSIRPTCQVDLPACIELMLATAAVHYTRDWPNDISCHHRLLAFFFLAFNAHVLAQCNSFAG